MFDITSSKLFLLAIVALLVIGPKDFPVLLRTIGKYVGIIRGHAREFRAQFDEAMRESELTQLKQDMEKMAHETEASLNATGREVEQSFDEARRGVESTVDSTVSNPLAPAGEPPAAAQPTADPPPRTAETAIDTTAEAPAVPPEAPAPEPVATVDAPAAAPATAAQPAVERTGA